MQDLVSVLHFLKNFVLNEVFAILKLMSTDVDLQFVEKMFLIYRYGMLFRNFLR